MSLPLSRHRLCSILISTALLAVSGLALPADVAAAEVDCTPSIDQSTVHFTPVSSAITSKGSRTYNISALITAPCGQPDGIDLSIRVGLTPVDFEHNLDWTVSSDITPTAAHTYQLSTSVQVKAAKIYNADASTWDGYVGVVDTDDPGEYGLTTYSDPVPVTIRLASQVTANASPEPVKKGKTITVRGTMSRANWDTGHDRTFGKQSVKLQFRTASGSYATVKTVHSSRTGKLEAKVTAKKTGYYRYAFPGSVTTASAVSPGDRVLVK